MFKGSPDSIIVKKYKHHLDKIQEPSNSGWWFQPIWKILVKLDYSISPGRDENKTYLKPPPRIFMVI